MSELNHEEIIDTCEWESHKPEGQPHTYQRVKRRKTVAEVHEELKAALGVDQFGYCSHPGLEEYFSTMTLHYHDPWPEGDRIIVYAVNGTSEGDYVHVAVTKGTDHQTVILGKTFMGRDAAWAAARRIADLLGA